MSKKTRRFGRKDKGEAPVEPAVEQATPAGDAVPEEDDVTRLTREVAELADKNLRLQAESDNILKRTRREQQAAQRYAEFDFARELLVVLDDLERTQESAQAATDVQALGDGVRIVYQHFVKVLSAHGISAIDVIGRTFDPTYHEAMLQQPSDEYESGTVMQELARGYTMHDRVLRSARVIVSSGPADANQDRGTPSGCQEEK